MTDYLILAQPRIRAATFEQILRANRSPAAPMARQAYRRILRHGVDPALALAVFQHESSYGRAGAAVRRHNWGNLRRSPGFRSEGGFVVYPSWVEGADDAARLLAIYGRNQIRPRRRTDSARTFPFVWAPSSDGNRPERYGRAIVRAVRDFIDRDEALGGGGGHDDDTGGRHDDMVVASDSRRMTAAFDRVRIRARPSIDARVLRLVGAATVATTDGTVRGSRYEHGGRSSDVWVRIRDLNGVALPVPVYSASLLWVPT